METGAQTLPAQAPRVPPAPSLSASLCRFPWLSSDPSLRGRAFPGLGPSSLGLRPKGESRQRQGWGCICNQGGFVFLFPSRIPIIEGMDSHWPLKGPEH